MNHMTRVSVDVCICMHMLMLCDGVCVRAGVNATLACMNRCDKKGGAWKKGASTETNACMHACTNIPTRMLLSSYPVVPWLLLYTLHVSDKQVLMSFVVYSLHLESIWFCVSITRVALNRFRSK